MNESWPTVSAGMAGAVLAMVLVNAERQEKKAKMTPEELQAYEEAERRAEEYRAKQRADEESRIKAEYDAVAEPLREQRRKKQQAKYEKWLAEQSKKKK